MEKERGNMFTTGIFCIVYHWQCGTMPFIYHSHVKNTASLMTYRLPFALFATANMPVRAAGQKPGRSAKSLRAAAAPGSFKQRSFSCAFAKRPLPPRACGDTAWNAPFDTRPQKHPSERSLIYTPGEQARECTTRFYIRELPKTRIQRVGSALECTEASGWHGV